MKRIVLLACGLLLLVASSAEARRRNYSNYSYPQPTYAAPVYTVNRPVQPAQAAPATKVTPASSSTAKTSTGKAEGTRVVAVSATTTAKASPTPAAKMAPVMRSQFDTSTAQGVANIMAARGVVGHFGGNPGYEGCGMAATPQAAYSICCYANSGMATVDVGYAQGANGMWYCCRRYR